MKHITKICEFFQLVFIKQYNIIHFFQLTYTTAANSCLSWTPSIDDLYGDVPLS